METVNQQQRELQNKTNMTADLSKYDAYYQNEFKKIIESNETYKGKWNWWAFLFSWIWLFTKGAWAYALIIISVNVLTFNSKIYLLLNVFWAVVMGLRGTWIAYHTQVKGKQMPKKIF